MNDEMSLFSDLRAKTETETIEALILLNQQTKQ